MITILKVTHIDKCKKIKIKQVCIKIKLFKKIQKEKSPRGV